MVVIMDIKKALAVLLSAFLRNLLRYGLYSNSSIVRWFSKIIYLILAIKNYNNMGKCGQGIS
ncbi:hypothetical protein EEL32_07080 [Brevibacillus laterosporus]|nr:hypothetical protein EEL32_07080 [Brevibacillus laterosporus]